MKRILAIAAREFLTAVANRAFVASLLVTPALLAVSFFVLPRLDLSGPAISGDVALIDHSGSITEAFRLSAAPQAIAAALGPLPVTSANLSGLPEASDAGEISDQLGEAIDLILDGGPARGGPPSTVVDCSAEVARILREGAIAADEVARYLRAAGLPDPER